MSKELNPPMTMRELQMRMSNEERNKLLVWLTTSQEIVGKEITVDLSQWNVGKLGHFICEIKEWKPNV